MSTRTPRLPSYRLHKQSGQAVVTLPDGLGGRRDILLGKHGTPESLAEYKRVMLEWQTNGHRPPPPKTAAPPDLTIFEARVVKILCAVKGVHLQRVRIPSGNCRSSR